MDCSGVCEDTQSDPNNCGGCGLVCGIGTDCSGGACVCSPASVSFAADVQPIFTAKCASAGCHASSSPQAGLVLASGSAYASIVNVNAAQCGGTRKRVLPGDPDNSYIIDKLLGSNLCGGAKMPASGTMDPGQIDTIAAWICAGAQNN